MLAAKLAHHLNIPATEIERLLALPGESLYDNDVYQTLVADLDAAQIEATAQYARQAYNDHLPPIKAKYGLSDTIMSAYTLCNWVLGYIMYPDKLPDLLARHRRIPVETMRAALPELIDLLDDLPKGREAWQRALIVFSLPLIAQGG